jgi:hypothetical protein
MITNVRRLAAAAALAASAWAADIESLAAGIGETIDWGKVDK